MGPCVPCFGKASITATNEQSHKTRTLKSPSALCPPISDLQGQSENQMRKKEEEKKERRTKSKSKEKGKQERK
jgi:hypothetical protein